eukprot:TRINITY_DN445_c0_g1_i1.p1 TRINITY_DN445_c0_g1~~TRINITY_DN445_c0_g1_i1.p1  ORF type:complete len:412 (+),score=33.85 TRINITY_DN445_c0_g1_i1:651-1886(+)
MVAVGGVVFNSFICNTYRTFRDTNMLNKQPFIIVLCLVVGVNGLPATPLVKKAPKLCPEGHIVRGIDQISLGMNATSLQVRTAFKDLSTALHAPFVYAIASLKVEPDPNQRSVALALMLGGLKIVLRKPPRQGIGLSPCRGSKETTMSLMQQSVPVKLRRDLQWALAVWTNTSIPAVYICRDPSCRPLGANDLLPEKRVFSDEKIYTRRQFLEAFAEAQEVDWKKGTVVPYNASEEIKRAQMAPQKIMKASNSGTLGPLQVKEIIIDFDPRFVDPTSLVDLASIKSVFPLPGNPQVEGEKVNCAQGCRWTYLVGPDLVLNPREFPEESQRKANVRCAIWVTQSMTRVRAALERHSLIGKPITNAKYSGCVRLSMRKYGITTHTGLWFCPKSPGVTMPPPVVDEVAEQQQEE